MDTDEKLRHWTDEGLIAPAQARAIAAHEAAASAEAGGWRLRVAEGLGALGGVVALAAALAVAGEAWGLLTTPGRVAVLAVVAGALLVAGRWAADRRARALTRLASGLLFGSTVAVAWMAGLLAAEGAGLDDDRVVLAVGLVTTAYAGWLWHDRPTELSQLALWVGVLITAVGALGATDPAFPLSRGALLVWGLAVGWALLAGWGVVRPRSTGYAYGGLTALVAAQALAFDVQGWGLALGLVTAVSLAAASAVTGEVALLGLGVVGGFVFVSQTVARYLGDSLGVPLGLLLLGLGLVASAVLLARLRPLTASRRA